MWCFGFDALLEEYRAWLIISFYNFFYKRLEKFVIDNVVLQTLNEVFISLISLVTEGGWFRGRAEIDAIS